MPTDQPRSDVKQYIVVARRYRPQSFEELVGQNHVAQALANAINTDRVGHAYLFTGARGVGKTSSARILAKALNCVNGPTPTPCSECDICESIASGEDVDVLEIDGASNRGIDEIRQLRSNVNIRPSRSRFKIYIIDEVHMLTTPAFNALLKTLEEPPEHVKFIFCTTDPEKIPITVLSRCQRFDFAPVETASIVERLRHIVESEGVEADDNALKLLARRASGSMRDSQSLLEQLLSFCEGRISVSDVHQMLGTAQDSRLTDLAQKLIDRDTAATLHEIDNAVNEGVDPGQLTEQLLGYFRDMMAATVGCDAQLMLHTETDSFDQLVEAGTKLGLETTLAVTQILDETLTRMRQSTHTRTLLEIAIVRICKLDDLDDLAELITQLKSGLPLESRSNRASRKPERTPKPPAPQTNAAQDVERPRATQKKNLNDQDTPDIDQKIVKDTIELTDENVVDVWQKSLASLSDMTSEFAGFCDRVAISAPNKLVVSFNAQYTHHRDTCERPERKQRLEKAVSELTGRSIRIDFEVLPGTAPASKKPQPALTKRQRMHEVEKHPLVREAIEVFDAEVTDLSPPRQAD